MPSLLKQCFPTGIVSVTPKALETLSRNGKTAQEFVNRHRAGDFGDIDICDQMVNTVNIRTGQIILSSYQLPKGGRVWVETSADRTRTTVSLRAEEQEAAR